MKKLHHAPPSKFRRVHQTQQIRAGGCSSAHDFGRSVGRGAHIQVSSAAGILLLGFSCLACQLPNAIASTRCKYCGAVTVKDATKDAVTEAVTRLRAEGKEPKKVLASAASERFEIIDRGSSELVVSAPYASLLLVCLDPADKKTFVVFNRTSAGWVQCHVFVVKERAADIVRSIGEVMSNLGMTSVCDTELTSMAPVRHITPVGPGPQQVSSRTRAGVLNALGVFDVMYLGHYQVGARKQVV